MVTRLPEELVIDILTRLPGKKVAQCTCVLKSWRSIIRSTTFSNAYRSRHPRGMVLNWLETVNPEIENAGVCKQLHYFYSPLCRLKQDQEGFKPLFTLKINRAGIKLTQIVNGLVCIGESFGLTIYNVCTGERMRIPGPLPLTGTYSTFHLGYSVTSKVYKILRLVFCTGSNCTRASNYRLEADILTLGPSSSLSTWRKLDYSAAGLGYLPLAVEDEIGIKIITKTEARTFPADGVLCWFWGLDGLVLFDLETEMFRRFKLPLDLKFGEMIVRAQHKEYRRAVSLWVLPRIPNCFLPECFVMEDSEGNKWRKQIMELSGGLATVFVAATGNFATNGDMLLMKKYAEQKYEDEESSVYSYARDEVKMLDQFWIGKVPADKPLEVCHCPWDYVVPSYNSRLSCLLDTSNLYRLLADILSGPPCSAS